MVNKPVPHADHEMPDPMVNDKEIPSAVNFYSRNALRFHDRYEKSIAFRERNELWAEWIERFAQPDHIAIDIGSGSGVFTFIAANHVRHVTGYDGSAEMVAFSTAQARDMNVDNVAFNRLLIEDLKQAVDTQFDLLMCSSVLEYLEDPIAALKVIRSLMKPNSTFLVSVPNGDSYYRWLEQKAFRLTGHPTYYRSVKTVMNLVATRQLFRDTGFRIIADTAFGEPPAARLFQLLRLTDDHLKTMRLFALRIEGV